VTPDRALPDRATTQRGPRRGRPPLNHLSSLSHASKKNREIMSGKRQDMVRKPASKFPHLQKKKLQRDVAKGIQQRQRRK